MSYPQNLQLYANMLTRDGTPYRNTSKLFDKILMSNDKSLGPDIKRDTQKTVVNQKLLSRIRAVVLDKSGPNRGHRDLRKPAGSVTNGVRKGAGKSTSKGKGKGKGKGAVPQLLELYLAEDNLLWIADELAKLLVRAAAMGRGVIQTPLSIFN